ncbi:PREDICTED: TSK-associating protein 1-like isoform X2 [Tarenaya hassleriana]|uniref:TSK-associating protein 1-like isoform X2 n=1 Tax=Tarenaya hassleriana TaxID=28532 RepID=UPI00053C99C7|nr:PREDICTED: TSK-associating protein 1-like isoform X2 [Tarenaya hassleriana]
MGSKFLVVCLFLSLVIASFAEVSCQYEAGRNEGSRGSSMLELIEHEHQATKQLKIDDFTGGKDDEELSAKRQSMLEEFELEYEASAKRLEQLKFDLDAGNDVEELSAMRKLMLEEIESEYEAASKNLQRLRAGFTETAKRKNMLEEIEREYEAAVRGSRQTALGGLSKD